MADRQKRVFVRGVPSDEQIDSMLDELGFPMDDEDEAEAPVPENDKRTAQGPAEDPAPNLDRVAQRALDALLLGNFTGAPVLGMPTSWEEGTPRYDENSPWTDQLFRLFVGVPAYHPAEVWELVVVWPGGWSVADATEFRLRRIFPADPAAGLVYGCVNLDAITTVGFCDHRALPHKARVLSFAEGEVVGVPALREVLEGQDALDLERILDVEGDAGFADVAAYFASRLPPIARAIVEGVFADPEPEPIGVPPFSLLPAGPEWEPEEWSPEDTLKRPLTEISVGGLPDVDGMVDAPDNCSDARLENIAEDHGWFSVGGSTDNPGGDWGLCGWASWAEGTLLTVGRNVDDVASAPEAWCMALPDFDRAEPENPQWWLELFRALALCAFGNPGHWPERPTRTEEPS